MKTVRSWENAERIFFVLITAVRNLLMNVQVWSRVHKLIKLFVQMVLVKILNKTVYHQLNVMILDTRFSVQTTPVPQVENSVHEGNHAVTVTLFVKISNVERLVDKIKHQFALQVISAKQGSVCLLSFYAQHCQFVQRTQSNVQITNVLFLLKTVLK